MSNICVLFFRLYGKGNFVMSSQNQRIRIWFLWKVFSNSKAMKIVLQLVEIESLKNTVNSYLIVLKVIKSQTGWPNMSTSQGELCDKHLIVVLWNFAISTRFWFYQQFIVKLINIININTWLSIRHHVSTYKRIVVYIYVFVMQCHSHGYPYDFMNKLEHRISVVRNGVILV